MSVPQQNQEASFRLQCNDTGAGVEWKRARGQVEGHGTGGNAVQAEGLPDHNGEYQEPAGWEPNRPLYRGPDRQTEKREQRQGGRRHLSWDAMGLGNRWGNGPGWQHWPILFLYLTLPKKSRNNCGVGAMLNFICLQVSCVLCVIIILANWTLLQSTSTTTMIGKFQNSNFAVHLEMSVLQELLPMDDGSPPPLDLDTLIHKCNSFPGNYRVKT